MKITRLRGWSIQVHTQPVESEEDPEWVLVFTERFPETGNEIRFEMNRDTRDAVVRSLTGGVVLFGGELPKV
jgi:hypothetical protein